MRRLFGLTLLLPLAACTERAPQPLAPESTGDPLASQHQASSPVVIVRQGPGANRSTEAGAPVVDNLADALDRVATGGTIRVKRGTYEATGLNIERPVTIVGDGTAPTLVLGDLPGVTHGFLISADGNTTIENLRFEGYRDPIVVSEFGTVDPYDLVIIDGVHLQLPDDFASGVSAFPAQHAPDGRRIEVLNSTIVGGWRGLHVMDDVPDFRAIGNALIDQNVPGASAAGFSRGASGRLEGNSFTGCENCVNVGGGDRTAGVVDIVGNDFTIDIGQPTANVIVATGLEIQILDNVVTGVGGARDPNDDSTWPIGNAILVESAEAVDVSGNSVGGAWIAYSVGFNTGTGTGLNNTADDVQTGFQAFSVDGSLSFRSSDFTNYHHSMNVGDDGFDLTCNWWGSAGGPHDANAPSDGVYTPWATGPVAGTSTTSCSGGL